MQKFTLDPQLEKDTLPITRLPLCHLALMNDSRYPWAILIPMKPGLTELIDLSSEEQAQLMEEIILVSRVLQTECGAYKLNTAALGNMVRQLHIHIIARQQDDPAWPGPIWGVGESIPYDPATATALINRLSAALSSTS